MHQEVSNDLTVGDFETQGGNEISEGDKAWVAALYPLICRR